MDIDFGSLLNDDDDAPLNPRDIFLTLDKDPAFSFLRDVQVDVLDKWFANRGAKDSVIKLNVGSGKTLVGLLALQSCLNEGVGPAVFVCPDKFLVEQALAEAAKLGIPATEDTKETGFIRGEKILITNIYKVFNGRSVFGVRERKIEIGSIVIDDAHACLSTIERQFKITLPAGHAVYEWSIKNFGAALKRQKPLGYFAIEAGDHQAFAEVPFWSVQEKASELLQELYQHREDENLVFTLPFFADTLPYSRVLLSGSAMEITPIFPPTDLVSSFKSAERRVYMTATLSDDSVLTTHLGAEFTDQQQPITAQSSQAMGERMILMPQELNDEISIYDLQELLVSKSKNHNVVVIVPSEQASKDWSGIADQVLMGDEVSPGIAKLKQHHVGLTVLVNRYDGIDLPQNACRILAIVGLPEATSLVGRSDSTILGDSNVGLRRQIQRIEQGMGRGVRSTDDFCVVLLFGAQLTGRLLSPAGQSMLTQATSAQLRLSKQLALQMTGASITDIGSVMDKCLDRDKQWVTASKKVLVKTNKENTFNFDQTQVKIRQAFDENRMNDHSAAAQLIQSATNDASDDSYKAWSKVRLAETTNFFDRSEAQRILQSAHRLNMNTLKPAEGVAYEKITGKKAEQAIASQKFFRDRYFDAPERILFAESVFDDLVFVEDTSERFEKAVNDLGLAIGLVSQMPERQFGQGPDNLWLLRHGPYLVIECKNGSTSANGISKTDLGQLEQATTWFEKRYGDEEEMIPVMIHPQSKLSNAGTALENMRIIDPKRLDLLRSEFLDFVKAVSSNQNVDNVQIFREALLSHNFDAPNFIKTYTIKAA